MIIFYTEKNCVSVKVEGQELPGTLIKTENMSNDEIVEVCKKWLKALGLEDKNFHVYSKIY